LSAIETVERLRTCLLRLEQVAGGPRLDIEWLRLRCDDTLRYEGAVQRDSIRQLQTDLSRFVEEFPGMLPTLLIEEVARICT
jgi:hypothetical protein